MARAAQLGADDGLDCDFHTRRRWTRTPLDGKRFALGAVALAFLVLTIVPLPAGMRGLMLDVGYL